MNYVKNDECIITEGKTFSVGERVIAVDSDYVGLKGYITDIRTGVDKETQNTTDDIYCCFDIPEDTEKIKLLEAHFSELFHEKKTIDDLALDLVIMAPCQLRRLDANE